MTAARKTQPAPLDLRRPFTLAQALAAGLTRRELRSIRFRRVHRGVYAATSAHLTPALRAEAALLTVPPPAYASHGSGARLLDVPIPVLPEEYVTVLHPRQRRANPGVVCHVRRGRTPVLYVGSERIPTSTYTQLFVELATLIPLVDLVAAGDHMVYKQHVTLAELREYCAEQSGPGAAAARRAVAYVRENVESVMETKLRMLCVLAGLPEPEVQIRIVDERGRLLRRHDMGYRDQRIAIEYDGRQHAEDDQQWEHDVSRREASDDDEWRTIIVLAKGIYREPENTLRRIHQLALKRGVPGVPRRLRDDWRRHFPGF